MNDPQDDRGPIFAAWATFEKEMLDSLVPIPDEQRERVRESFFAGQRALLSLTTPQLNAAESPKHARGLLQNLRKAVNQAMDETD